MGVFVFALLLRLAMLGYYHDSYLDTSRMMTHYELAHQLIHGNGFVVDDGFLAKARDINGKQQINNDYYKLNSQVERANIYSKPIISDVWGYAVLLAMIWKISGIESLIPLQIIQVSIDALMVLFIYCIAMVLFKRRSVAIASSIAYALFIPFVYLSSIANRDIFASWGMVVTTYLILKTLYEGKFRYAWVAGIVLAISCWFRPFIIYLPAVFLLYSLVIKWRSFRIHVHVLCGTLMPLLLLFVIPFSTAFSERHGTFRFISTDWMVANLWEGFGSYENSFGFVADDDAYMKRAKDLGFNGQGFTPEFFGVVSKDVKSVLKKHPEFYLEYMHKNIGSALTVPLLMGERVQLRQYTSSGDRSFIDFVLDHPFSFIAKVLKNILGWVLPLLSFAALIMWRRKFATISILPMLYLSKVFVHGSLYFEPRMILEGYFPLLILCAAFVVGCYEDVDKSESI